MAGFGIYSNKLNWPTVKKIYFNLSISSIVLNKFNVHFWVNFGWSLRLIVSLIFFHQFSEFKRWFRIIICSHMDTIVGILHYDNYLVIYHDQNLYIGLFDKFPDISIDWLLNYS